MVDGTGFEPDNKTYTQKNHGDRVRNAEYFSILCQTHIIKNSTNL